MGVVTSLHHPTGERLLEGGCAPPKKLFIIIFLNDRFGEIEWLNS